MPIDRMLLDIHTSIGQLVLKSRAVSFEAQADVLGVAVLRLPGDKGLHVLQAEMKFARAGMVQGVVRDISGMV